MAEYIEREALISEYDKAVKGLKDNSHNMSVQDYIEQMAAVQAGKTMTEAIPAADVVARDCYDRLLAENDELRKERPVRHGKWEKSYADHEAFGVRPFFRYCSECYEATVHQYNYCPNCGARMDKDKEVR